MALYPGALPAAGSASATDTLAVAGHTSLHNTGADESRAIATKIGTGSSTPTSGLLLRGNGSGTSAWSQAVLTTDVSGVLPVANGGTGVSTSTGSGANVLGTAPTISGAILTGTPILTTPTIADFTNSNHDHTNTAGGGSLGANTVNTSQLVNNAVTFAKLLSTIFSDQVSSQANAGSAGGTMYYINLGGMKLCFGTTATQTIGGAAPASAEVAVTLPASFFTTVQTALATGQNVNQASIYAYVQGGTVSTVTFNLEFIMTVGTAGQYKGAYLVIGT